MKLGIIGYGNIAQTLLSCLAREFEAPLDRLEILAKPNGAERAWALAKSHSRIAQSVTVETDFERFLSTKPDLVIECAGQEAVAQYAPAVLMRGFDCVVTSVGALADDDLHAAMTGAAARSGARLHCPSGAIGALDILGAARLSGLDAVTYISRKPPGAWRGTPAERLLDLDTIQGEAILYEGTARAAARDYPKNANVAATVALAGLGFDKTHVRLVADSRVTRNVHEIAFRAQCADVQISIAGKPSPSNPKTSLTTAYSLAHLVLGRVAHELIG